MSDIVQEPDPSDPSDPNRLLNAALDALGCPPEERARAERELLFAAEVYHATQRAPEELAPSTAQRKWENLAKSAERLRQLLVGVLKDDARLADFEGAAEQIAGLYPPPRSADLSHVDYRPIPDCPPIRAKVWQMAEAVKESERAAAWLATVAAQAAMRAGTAKVSSGSGRGDEAAQEYILWLRTIFQSVKRQAADRPKHVPPSAGDPDTFHGVFFDFVVAAFDLLREEPRNRSALGKLVIRTLDDLPHLITTPPAQHASHERIA